MIDNESTANLHGNTLDLKHLTMVAAPPPNRNRARSLLSNMRHMEMLKGDTHVASPRWAVAAPIACGCSLVAAVVYVATHDPAAPGTHLPACPFYAMTGLWCPGCGLTRATHALLHGNIATALGFNLFLPVFLAGIVVGWFAWMRMAVGLKPIAWLVQLPTWLLVTACTALIVFGVLRNLPGFEALAPKP